LKYGTCEAQHISLSPGFQIEIFSDNIIDHARDAGRDNKAPNRLFNQGVFGSRAQVILNINHKVQKEFAKKKVSENPSRKRRALTRHREMPAFPG
jgi:hypothetical protein